MTLSYRITIKYMNLKILFIVITFTLLTSCNKEQKLQPDWLIGNWVRENDTKGQNTFENWTKFSSNEYRGNGYTLKKKDTIFSEKLRLLNNNGNWKLEVTGVNSQPTYFNFIAQTKTGFICENKKNEFPKKISYNYVKGKLIAEISDESQKIQFNFRRKN